MIDPAVGLGSLTAEDGKVGCLVGDVAVMMDSVVPKATSVVVMTFVIVTISVTVASSLMLVATVFAYRQLSFTALDIKPVDSP